MPFASCTLITFARWINVLIKLHRAIGLEWCCVPKRMTERKEDEGVSNSVSQIVVRHFGYLFIFVIFNSIHMKSTKEFQSMQSILRWSTSFGWVFDTNPISVFRYCLNVRVIRCVRHRDSPLRRKYWDLQSKQCKQLLNVSYIEILTFVVHGMTLNQKLNFRSLNSNWYRQNYDYNYWLCLAQLSKLSVKWNKIT